MNNELNNYKAQEEATNAKVDAIENLFKEQDKADQDFSAISLETNRFDDSLEQTKEINEIDLENLKKLSEHLHAIYDETEDENEEIKETNSNEKGKALVKTTKQGIAFSNQNLTKTFLDCAILCFVTATIGGSWFLYILNHLN